MAATYSYSGDPSTSDKDAVRFYVQDTGPTSWLTSDQEINFVLGQYANALLAAAQVCRALAAKFAQKVSKSVGDLRISYSDKSKQYLALADDLEAQGSLSGITPYAGGTSCADKQAVEQNTDRPAPPFKVTQFDNPSGLNNTAEDSAWDIGGALP